MLLIVFSIFLTTKQVSKINNNQETRSHAATTDIKLTLGTSSPTNTFYYTASGLPIDTDVNIDTAGNAVKGVDFSITYDPTKFVIYDADTNTPGTQITPGTVLPTVLMNTVDTTNGIIKFSVGVDLTSKLPFTGTGKLASIRFLAGSVVDPSNINFMPSPDTQVLLSNGTVGASTPTNAVFHIILDTTAPTVPVLSGPSSGAKINSQTIQIFSWSTSTDNGSGLASYDIQIATNNTFTSGLQQFNTTSTSYNFPSLSDGTYYWRVRANDKIGNQSAWSSGWSFVLDKTAPTQPTLNSPTNNTNLQTKSTTLTWQAATDITSGVASYNIQTALNNTFTSGLQSYTSTTTSFATPNFTDGTVYWRVQAVDGAGNAGSFSFGWNFTVDTQAPSIPVLNSFSGPLTTRKPTLTWLASTDSGTGINHYDIQIANNNNFTGVTAYTSTTTSYTLATALPADGIYYWRVMTTDNIGNQSAWSLTGNFTVSTSISLNFSVKIDGAGISTTARRSTTVDIVIEPASGGTPLGTFSNIPVTHNNTTGVYTNSSPVALTGISAGSYRILVKGASQLRREVASTSQPQTLTFGLNTVDWTNKILLGGDNSNDNRVDLSDFDLLATDYRNSTTQTTSKADFNLDSLVDLSDFDILATNYRLAGDPL